MTELRPLEFVPPPEQDEQLRASEAAYMVALQQQRDSTANLLAAIDEMLALLTQRMSEDMDA